MRHFITLIALCVTAPVLAADGPLDARYLRNHAETRGFSLGRPTRIQITPDAKAVLFLRAQPRVAKMSLYEFDVATAKTRELLTPEKLLKGAEEKLTPEEKARRERLRIGVGGFTNYQLSPDGKEILLSLSGHLYVVKRADGDARELKTGEGTITDPKFSPDGKMVGYVRDHDVYVYDLATDKEHAVTKGGTEKKSNGEAEFVAQEEMDRHSGYWWSPDSKFIAYEEADADGVEVWYVADPSKPDQPGFASYYPRPGKDNVKVRVGIVPVTGGKTVWIDWDAKKYPYLAQVRWDKEGPLTITVQTRDQKELVLLKVNPETGKTTSLVTEKDDAWVNIDQTVPHWLEGGKAFLWTTEGRDRIELQQRRLDDGEFAAPVPMPPNHRFLRLISADAKGKEIAFLRASTTKGDDGVRSDPTATKVGVVVSLDKGLKVGTLTKENGWHSAVFSKDHSLRVVTSTTPDRLARSVVYHRDGTVVGELPSIAEEPGFTPRLEFLRVGDGEGYEAVIVRPQNFDPKKKYPVIVDVYGGPGHQTVVKAMRNWLLMQWLADQGFIVVAFDNRGTPARGRDWERSIYKKFGSVPLDDQVAALQALGKKVPELDLERVGIFGWSFGGYMSALAVLKRPDIFKAGVAGAPVTDWYDYDTHYTERYLGVPKDKDDPAYKDASLLPLAKDLKRPLLLVHGTADDNVYFRHTLKLADALFKEGKDFDVLPLAGLTHMVSSPVAMEQLYTRIARYFQKHLGKPVAR